MGTVRSRDSGDQGHANIRTSGQRGTYKTYKTRTRRAANLAFRYKGAAAGHNAGGAKMRHPSRQVRSRCAGGAHHDQYGHRRRRPLQSPAGSQFSLSIQGSRRWAQCRGCENAPPVAPGSLTLRRWRPPRPIWPPAQKAVTEPSVARWAATRCARKFAAKCATLRRDPRLVGRANRPRLSATWSKCARRATTFPTCWAGQHPPSVRRREMRSSAYACISCAAGPPVQ